MSSWKATLFGKFNVEHDEISRPRFDTRQVQELFGYLLLFWQHPQPREALIETLWGDQPVGKARKKLRQTLWRLQSALGKQANAAGLDLLTDNEWIEIVLPAGFWLDTKEFENIFNSINEKRIQELNMSDLQKMQHAANIYKGDLLEGWYPDWCIFERERFQIMHLLLLDKLVQFCELHQKYDSGLSYAMKILRHDSAYERAHQQLMRLYYLSGNRTQALHQYERCVIALQRGLDVEPSEKTKQLYETIRLDAFKPPLVVKEIVPSQTTSPSKPTLNGVLNRLEEVSETLRRLDQQIKEEIAKLGSVLST